MLTLPITPDLPTAARSRPVERQGRLLAIAVAIGVPAAFIADRSLAPGELVLPLGPDAVAGAVFVSVFLSVLCAVSGLTMRRARQTSPRQLVGTFLFVPAVLLLACLGGLRFAVQFGAFTGWNGTVVPAEFAVVGTRTGRSSRYLRVRLAPGAREFSLPVGRAIYDDVRPGDSITLPIEQGRFGVYRALVDPRPEPSALHHRG